MRPSAFSMVPVQSEQCRPPILARIFLRFGRVDGSSVQRANGEVIAVEEAIGISVKGAGGALKWESKTGRADQT
jgi:hypothetical protein